MTNQLPENWRTKSVKIQHNQQWILQFKFLDGQRRKIRDKTLYINIYSISLNFLVQDKIYQLNELV